MLLRDILRRLPGVRLASWSVAGVVTIVLTSLSLPALGQEQSSTTNTPGPDTSSRGFPALIEAVRRADVTAAVESTIKEIHFAPGQTVTSGEILITLDDRKFQLAVQNAEANFRRAERVLQAARGELERTQKLHDRGSASNVQMLKSQVSVSLAEAVLDEARATLETEQTNLERTVLRAPITGIIGRHQIEVGGLVSPGFSPSLAQIVQMDPIMVAYQIPYVERLEQLGAKKLTDLEGLLRRVELTIKISDTWIYEYKAVPKHGAADLNSETGEMTIWAEVPNQNYLLRPGMRVSVFSNLGPGDLDQ